ncbi:MAG: hypothetical protein Q9174_001494 [Haloplaca sp. 1 TL-2023]
MKAFSTLATLAFVAIAQAQEQCAASASAIPSCALSCIESAGSEVQCTQGDYACQCEPTKSAAIASAALGCVISACGPATGLAVQTAASAVCDCVATAAPVSADASSTAAETSPTGRPSLVATPMMTTSAPYPTSTADAVSSSAPSASGGVGAGSEPVAPFIGGASLLTGSITGVMGAFLFVVFAL